MKNKFFFSVLLCTLFFSSCKKETEEAVQTSNYSCLIVNQGNYTESNGSLSIIKEDGTVQNQIYKNVNGYAIGSIIESVVDCGSSWAMICNNQDKVEFVDKLTFETVHTFLLQSPRYGVYVDGKLYVTSCDYSTDFNKVYELDLANHSTIAFAEIDGTPEGIIAHDNCLWVATSSYNSEIWSSYDPTVCSVSLKDTTVQTYVLNGENLGAKHLIVDSEGSVWVSMTGYGVNGAIAKVDKANKTLSDKIELAQINYSGHIYTAKDNNQVYFMTSDGYSSGAADENTTVKIVDLSAKEVKTIAEGKGFYGFGVNELGEVYTANVSGFATNSVLAIYGTDGQLKNNGELVGVGACRFMFPQW